MKKKIAQIREYAFHSNFSFWLLLILLLSLFSRGFPVVSKFYIITPILLLFFTVVGFEFRNDSKHFKIFIFFIFLFTIWSIVTAFWSEFPLFTIKRGIYFFIVSVGSFIIGYKLLGNNLRFLYYSFLILNVAIITVTLISLVTNLPETAWTGGHGLGFMGFTNHQNKLGQYIFLSVAPLILFIRDKNSKNEDAKNKVLFGFSIIPLFTKERIKVSFTNENNPKSTLISKYFIFFLLGLNLILIALSVSRAAILALFLTWSVYFLLKFSLLKTLVFSLVFGGIIFSTVFITKKYTNNHKVTIIKNENYLGQRREKTIYYSWKAALNGGLTGLGYGISDKRFKPELLGYYDKTSEGKIFRREKTISVLALIEEVGIIGLSLFLVIILYPIKLIWNNISSINKKNMPARRFFWRVIPDSNITRHSEFISESKKSHVIPVRLKPESIIIFSFAFLISLSIYAQIESWWIGVGSAVMPVYFIFTGAVMKELKY